MIKMAEYVGAPLIVHNFLTEGSIYYDDDDFPLYGWILQKLCFTPLPPRCIAFTVHTWEMNLHDYGHCP